MVYGNPGTRTERVRARNRAVYDRNKALIRAAKEKPCTDCIFPYYCMDLDHVEVGELNGKRLACESSSWGLARLTAGLARTEPVCAVCHRIRTHQRAGYVD